MYKTKFLYTTFVVRIVKMLAGQVTIGTASLTGQAEIIISLLFN